jgi:hypothetical protein
MELRVILEELLKHSHTFTVANKGGPGVAQQFFALVRAGFAGLGINGG